AGDGAERILDGRDGGCVAGKVGKVGLEIEGAGAEGGKLGAHGVGCRVALGDARYGDVEAFGRKRPGDAEADAAAAAGDDGDGACWGRHAARSLDWMWSATRSAWAATESAGFTAADVGR